MSVTLRFCIATIFPVGHSGPGSALGANPDTVGETTAKALGLARRGPWDRSCSLTDRSLIEAGEAMTKVMPIWFVILFAKLDSSVA